MAYNDFLEHYARTKGMSVDAIVALAGGSRSIRYALKNRDRGRACVERVHLLYNRPLAGASVLEIGCGFGGTCIELAKAGASVVGVEVVPSYARLARINASSEVQAEFYTVDFTSKRALTLVGDRKFDIFILNHVLEHIYDTVSLLENVSAVASSDAVLIFDLPNGHSIQSVEAEGHTGFFLASLVDPDCWYMFKRTRARIYYRKWQYYESLLKTFGFPSIVRARVDVPSDPAAKLRAFVGGLGARHADTDEPEELKAVTKDALDRYIEEVEHDIRLLPPDEIEQKYFAYFWKGVAAKHDELIPTSVRTHLSQSDWGI
jgi:2-polyprenyl-3-methyl-5-hydroxy-6-metoxy-1,4-benzoquinol methylase